MSDLIRLTPIIYLYTPLGVAEAHFLESSGPDVPLSWVTFQCETKENWNWANQHVRLCESISIARSADHSPIHLPQDLFDTLAPHILRHKKSPLYAQAAQYHRGEI